MENRKKGILCIMCAAFFFSLMSVFVRLSGDLPSAQKGFFRNVVAMCFALSVVCRNKTSLKVDKEKVLPLLCRSIFGTMGILFNFYAVDHLVLADATILNKLSPFFAIVFSLFLLKEKVSLPQGLCVATAFIGSLMIVKPGLAGIATGPALIGLMGGMCAGAAYTFVRILGKKGMKGPVIVFYFSACSCLLLLPNLLLNYHPMTTLQLASLLMAGLSAAGGQFSITAAYTHAPAREISVYDYTQVIFGAIFGYLLFGQTPDLLSFLGYAIIIGAAIAMYLHNRKN